jgi:hypothetical protein
MKITLTKKVTLPHGKKVDKGLTLEVVNEYGQELIEAGKAVEYGAEAPQVIEEQINKLD